MTEETTQLVIESTVDGKPVKEPVKKGKSKERPKKRRYKADPYIWGIYIMLLIFSVVELFSASSREVTGSNVYEPLIRHVRFLLVGFVIVLVLQRTHYKWFRKYAMPLAVISLGMLIYVVKAGATINDAARAIVIPGFGSIQPPEIAKLTCMLFIATIMAKYQMRGGVTTKGVIIASVAVLVFCGCTFKNGLTNTLILMGVSMCMFLIGGIQWKKLGVVVLVYGVFAGCYYTMKPSHDAYDEAVQTEMTASVVPVQESGVQSGGDRSKTWTSRISAHLKGVNPEDSINDENRQVFFSKFAQANGGVLGRGPGNSRESARLPLAFCDYIYAIIVEDTGFVGGVILLIFYLCLLARAGSVASRCSRAFPALLIMGCAVMIVFQALIHMAIVVGLSPVSGQPLPIISKGGTSILVMSVAIGMMLSVSRFAVRSGDKKEIKGELKELPEDLQSANPTNISGE